MGSVVPSCRVCRSSEDLSGAVARGWCAQEWPYAAAEEFADLLGQGVSSCGSHLGREVEVGGDEADAEDEDQFDGLGEGVGVSAVVRGEELGDLAPPGLAALQDSLADTGFGVVAFPDLDPPQVAAVVQADEEPFDGLGDLGCLLYTSPSP